VLGITDLFLTLGEYAQPGRKKMENVCECSACILIKKA